MYRIKEVSQRTGVLSHTLRYWEKEFGELLAPSRSQGKHRFYSDEDVSRVALIKKLLKEDGYSIQGAKRFLDTLTVEASQEVAAGMNGNGHSNGKSNGNGNGHVDTTGLPESLVDRIAAAVARRVADMIREPEPATGNGHSDVMIDPVPLAAAAGK
ncbi:MAG: MerR family transcriptional regulator [Nitrospirae bacterium]|nr:MerR family transcriptional regulator [Nitrospirota bacterium]